jgi:hypothetical protein
VTLTIYYSNGGDDPTTAYVPVERAKTERGARRHLSRGIVEHWGDEPGTDHYVYRGISRRERLHDHHGDDPCPGRDCLGPECTYVDDYDAPTHGPGCPMATPCPRPMAVHVFEVA